MSSLSSSGLSILNMRLLGLLEIDLNGQPLTSRLLAKAQALLIYLAVTGQPQPRTNLMVLLWGDSSEDAARMSLRQVLTNLRAQLDPFLLIERQMVALHPDAKIWIDAVSFEQQMANALAQQDVDELEAALALYRGELLSGFNVRNAADFDRWLYGEQERLRRLAVRGLEALASAKASAGKLEEAIAHLRRALVLEPWREEAHRRLIELYMQASQRSAALAHYETLVRTLSEELGVEPSPESVLLYAQIQHSMVKAEAPKQQENYTEPPPSAELSTTLVGRQSEWQRLLQAWQRSSQGQAQMALIAGEAGIGKTRLADEFANWVRRQGGRIAGANCYAAEGELAFTPIIELLRSEQVLPALAMLDEVWLAQVARLLPELVAQHPQLRIPEASGDPLQRQHFFEALARAILAGKRPTLLVIDDLQWADRETLEWLHYLLRFASQARLLLVGTLRTEEVMADHPVQPLLVSLRRAQRLVEIHLDGLSRIETGALAAQVSGQEVPSTEVVALYQQTEGNPLFVVETVRARLEWRSGTSSHSTSQESAAVPLPEGIRAVIRARLAQLSPLAQEVAQLAAAIGRAFSLELLARAGNYPEEELLEKLDELWQRHILQDLNGSGYDFSHARIRDVAYGQLSPLRRRLLHRRVAQALEQLNPHQIDGISGLIAAHYELGDQPVQAIGYYQKAAHFAHQAYAHQEAVEALRKALGLLPALSDGKEQRHQELKIQMMLGNQLMMLKGLSDVEAQRAYDRALVLCQGSNTSVEFYEAMWGLHEIYLFQANGAKALEASQVCWELAQRSDDPELLLQAHHAFWGLYFWFYIGPKGLQSAVEHARQGIALYQPEWHHTHVLRFGGHDPGICAYNILSNAQAMLGYADQAVSASHDGVALAIQLDRPFSLASALLSEARTYAYLDEPTIALTYLDQLGPLLREYEMPLDKAQELIWRGWALGQLKPGAEAVSLVQQGLNLWREFGDPLDQPEGWARLADVCIRHGDFPAARNAIAEGLALANRTGEDSYRSELYRLQGQCWLAAGDVAAAQAGFQQALVLAQSQQLRMLELRTAMDLSQLWEMQGRRAEAYVLLNQVYSWFTEGFTTGNLRRAQELLSALAP